MINKIYYSTDVSNDAICRKPNLGMGYKAKIDFPEIDFTKSVMVGDSVSDMEFAENLGMKKILIGKSNQNLNLDGRFSSLYQFCNCLKCL
jgi:histidinol phosphatase-like enzyme